MCFYLDVRFYAKVLAYYLLCSLKYFETRRGDYSSLFFNSVLVFLAAMVLTNEGDTTLGFVFMAVAFLLGTIFSKGGK